MVSLALLLGSENMRTGPFFIGGANKLAPLAVQAREAGC